MSEKFDIRTGSSQKLPFATLLREVHKIAGIEKIDFISSNPFDFTNDLIDAITSPKISNYLHIAAQSGNNDVLKRMNRRHTVQDFMDLKKQMKKNDILVSIQFIIMNTNENEVEKKQAQVVEGEKVFEYQKSLLNARAKSYYKNASKNSFSFMQLPRHR